MRCALHRTAFLAAALLALALPASAEPRRWLGPTLSETMNGLVRRKAFEAVVPAGWKVQDIRAEADRVHVSFTDNAKREHAIDLTLAAEGATEPKGRYFQYEPARSEPPAARAALLRAAALIDDATTPDVIFEEAPAAPPSPPPAPVPPPPAALNPPPPPAPAPQPQTWFAGRFTMPLAGALLVAIAETLIILLALLAAFASLRPRSFLWSGLLLLCAMWSLFHNMGTSPAVWEDTLVENLFIHDCLHENRCTMLGAIATVGVPHSAGYLHWRTLLEWLGFGANAVHALLITLSALGVVLSSLAAERLGGRAAGTLAALLMLGMIGVPMQLDVISDAVPLPFLGALFLALGVALTMRPSLRLTVLLGLVGGVTANVYVIGLLCGISGVWIVALLPERRWALMRAFVLAFALSTFLLSPATWIYDLHLLWTRSLPGGPPQVMRGFADSPMLGWTVLATAIWIAAAAMRPAFRRLLDVPIALVLPLLVPFLLGIATHRLDAQDKYCASIVAAVATALGLAFAAGLESLTARFAPQRVSILTGQLPPVIAVALMGIGAVAPQGRMPSAPDFTRLTLSWHELVAFLQPHEETWYPPLTYADLQSTQQILIERGWSWSDAAVDLRTISATSQRAAHRWLPGWPEETRRSSLERAYLLKFPRTRLPNPLPPSVTLAHSGSSEASVVAVTCSWIDWRAFEVCSTPPSGARTCVSASQSKGRDPHTDYDFASRAFPPRQQGGQLELVLPLHPAAACAEYEVRLPRLTPVCPGRITDVQGLAAEIDPAHQTARFKYSGAEAAGARLSLTWDLSAPECSGRYETQPPFFLEGNPATVSTLDTMLQALEAKH